MNARRLAVAHQLGADTDAWLRTRLPSGVRIDRLPDATPWALPDGTTVLLVANGKLRNAPRDRPSWADGLEWVHMRPTGVDEAPDWLFDIPNVTVSRGAAAVAISEYVLAAMLDFEKQLNDLRVSRPTGWAQRPMGSLAGRRLGLFGFGEIGRAIAVRALAFGMEVVATRRSSGATVPGVSLLPLSKLCSLSDHLVLCAPMTGETAGIFGDDLFAKCRPGTHLINVARGGLIQPDALRRALDGPIARATLDVWYQEPPAAEDWVYSHPRAFLTPHCSFRGNATETRLREILEMNLAAWIAAQPQSLFGRVNPSARF